VLAAGKGRVLPVLAMLAAKRRLRVAARGSGPGAKRRRPCPPLRAAAAERRRDEERPAPSTPPPAGRTRNWTRCSAPRLPRRSQRCPLMRLGQHGPWQGFGSRVHTGAPGEDRRGPSPCHGPICCGSRLFQASSAIRAFRVRRPISAKTYGKKREHGRDPAGFGRKGPMPFRRRSELPVCCVQSWRAIRVAFNTAV